MGFIVTKPFEVFNDLKGNPLENGMLFIGVTNLNPIDHPVPVFFDEALDIPAAQPIRTIGGYPSQNGTPANIYIENVNYSITVHNKNNKFIYSRLDSDNIPDEVLARDTITGLEGLTSIKKASLDNNQQALAGGYNVIGDGGGTPFFWDSTSTDTQNLITIFEADDGGTGRWIRNTDDLITDKMAGVTGDGTTDDTVRTQAFLDFIVADATNPGIATFTAGTIKLTSKVVVDISSNNLGFSMIGDGRVDIVSEVLGAPAIEIQNAIFFKMEGINFEGNGIRGASGNGHGLALTDTSFGSGTFFPQQVQIENCNFNGFKGNDVDDDGGAVIRSNGIYVSNGLAVTIKYCFITDCGVGIRFQQTQNFNLKGVVITLCDVNGLHLVSTTDGNNIIGCDILNSGDDNGTFTSTVDGKVVPNGGILLETVSGVVNIEGCKFKNSISQIVAVGCTAPININGNHIRPLDKTSGNGDSGIFTTNTNMVNIRDNDFLYVTDSGANNHTGIELISNESSGDFVHNIENNIFLHGDTVDEDILVDGNGSTRFLTLNIKGNKFGDGSRAGTPLTTACIKVTNAALRGKWTGNLFIVEGTGIITDAIDIATGVTLEDEFIINGNSNKEFSGGTITNFALPTENAQNINSATDSSGDHTITHGMIATPQKIVPGSQGTTPRMLSVHTVGATTFKVRVYDAAGAAVTSSSSGTAIEWMAKV